GKWAPSPARKSRAGLGSSAIIGEPCERKRLGRRRIGSGRELRRGARDAFAEITGTAEIGFARLARAIAVGDRRRAIGRAALDLVNTHLTGKAVIEPDDRHAEVEEVGEDREERRFLTAMLRCGRGEGGA